MTTIQEFNQIDGRISSLYHAAALKMGLSDSEFRILYTLAVNAPGYLQSALREATGMGRSTVNSALKKLEREKGSSKIFYERLLTELMGKLEPSSGR